MAIKKEFNKPKDLNRYKEMKKYSWKEVAKQVKKIYERVQKGFNPSSGVQQESNVEGLLGERKSADIS